MLNIKELLACSSWIVRDFIGTKCQRYLIIVIPVFSKQQINVDMRDPLEFKTYTELKY